MANLSENVRNNFKCYHDERFVNDDDLMFLAEDTAEQLLDNEEYSKCLYVDRIYIYAGAFDNYLSVGDRNVIGAELSGVIRSLPAIRTKTQEEAITPSDFRDSLIEGLFKHFEGMRDFYVD